MGRRDAWEPWRCQHDQFVAVTLLGRSIQVAPPAVPAFQALDRQLTVTGYEADVVQSYNCRRIRFGLVWSWHSYGTATDIDPLENPYLKLSRFDWGATKFTPEQIEAVESLRTVNGRSVWIWGGRWNSIKDYMHFEVACTPDDLATGILDPMRKRPDREALVTMAESGIFGNVSVATFVNYWDGKAQDHPEWYDDFWPAYERGVAAIIGPNDHDHDERYALRSHPHSATTVIN